MEDALRRDSHALALERGVRVAGRLWSPLTDLRTDSEIQGIPNMEEGVGRYSLRSSNEYDTSTI